MNEEQLNKSIDAMIDEYFSAEEKVEKSKAAMSEIIGEPKQSKVHEDPGPAQTKADDVKVAKPKQEKEGENGRPKSIADVPNEDEDGSRAKGYEHIQEESKKTPEVSPKGTIVKSIEISQEDFELLQKAKETQKEEVLKKAREEQTTLIKAAVSEAISGLKAENEQLKKSFEEAQALIKAIAKQPKPAKSVTQVQALEKSFSGSEEIEAPAKEQKLTKSEMLDVAEELFKAKEITLEECIELEDTGFVLNPESRRKIERAISKRR